MSQNPFYIAPLDLSQGLQGLGAGLMQMKQRQDIEAKEQKAIGRQQQAQEAFQAAMGDPLKMANLAVEYPEMSTAFRNAFGIANEQSDRIIQDAGFKVMQVSDPSVVADELERAAARVSNVGGNPVLTNESIQRLRAGGRESVDELANIKGTLGVMYPQLKELIPKNKPMYTGVQVDTDSGRVIYTNTATGDTKVSPIDEFNKSDMTPKDFREFQKETRSSLRGDYSALEKQASEITDSYTKVQKNIEAAKAGNRTAIASVIMNVARLNSPGVVTEQDFQSLVGSQNILGAVSDLLRMRGIDPDALQRGLDPTNPDTFDAESLMTVAENLVASGVPTIKKRYSGLREKGRIAELPDQVQDTIFAGGSLIDELDNLIPTKASYPGAPSIGSVVDGYEYIGGNPADQSSWRAK